LLQVTGAEPPVAEALLTVSEAAKRLRLSIYTVYRHCAVGRIAHLRLGGVIRIPESALQETGQAASRRSPTKSAREPTVRRRNGRAAFRAVEFEVAAALRSGWTMFRIFQEKRERLQMSYAQFTRYVKPLREALRRDRR